MRARTAAQTVGFALSISVAATLAGVQAAEVKAACDEASGSPADCAAVIDPVETGAIGDDAAGFGLLLDNSELVLPGMTLRIMRPVKLRRADAVI